MKTFSKISLILICLNLIEISLPSALSNIEDKAFKGCVSLSTITVTNDLSDSQNLKELINDLCDELKKILNSYF